MQRHRRTLFGSASRTEPSARVTVQSTEAQPHADCEPVKAAPLSCHYTIYRTGDAAVVTHLDLRVVPPRGLVRPKRTVRLTLSDLKRVFSAFECRFDSHFESSYGQCGHDVVANHEHEIHDLMQIHQPVQLLPS